MVLANRPNLARMQARARRISPSRIPQNRRASAFSLLELVIVIGTLGYLLALLLPALQSARRSALQAQCALNLRQLGAAFQSYANDNDLFIPRDCTLNRPDRAPWPLLLGPYLTSGRDLDVADLPSVRLLQCPAHPLTPLGIPTGYVINAFAFDTAPDWAPDGPIKMTLIRDTSDLPWLLEAANSFPWNAPGLADPIFGIQFHDIYDPSQLPEGDLPRITERRHGDRANVLYLDGHVAAVQPGDLTIGQFDDHASHQATDPPDTDGS